MATLPAAQLAANTASAAREGLAASVASLPSADSTGTLTSAVGDNLAAEPLSVAVEAATNSVCEIGAREP